jgi:HAD superfamily hydrolase (TIGR01509 family)
VTAGAPRPFRLRAVLFDFDGTLTRPGALEFAALKRELGCPPGRFVLEWLEALPAGARRRDAFAALERFELAGAAASVPNTGAEDLVARLRAAGLKVGVLTRNGRTAVDAALARFARLDASAFDVIVTRDDEPAPKPSPAGVVHAAEAMDVAPAELLVVGDYVLDVLAGRAAGAVTAYLTNGGGGATRETATAARARSEAGRTDGSPDFVVHDLAELDEVVRLGLALPPGKLPNDLLARHLEAAPGAGDESVLVPAGVGEDVVAMDVGDRQTLVAHGDPITLTGSHLGRFAALVNANDVATAGAEPRWLLSTTLLPPGTTASQALCLLADVAAAAAAAGAPVVGGHTEVTDAVTRPVVSITALGTVAREQLRDKRSIRPGDKVVLTKALAVEGTAVLAAEAAGRLLKLGMSERELDECRALLPQMSVLPEARVAATIAGVRAMHDVTEGGLATALRELAHAGGHDVRVDCEVIPVLPQTTRVCALLGADPLGLIASGSLLVCCAPEETISLLDALAAARVPATVIGEVGAAGGGVSAWRRGQVAPWPAFATDEVARLLAEK